MSKNIVYKWQVTVNLNLPNGSGHVGALIHAALDRKRFRHKWQARWYAFKLTNRWPRWAIHISPYDSSGI